MKAKTRLEELRAELRAERISYDELAELESLREYIEPGDVELLEAVGAPEFPEEKDNNKLIAEFMGFKKDSEDLYLIDDYRLRSEDQFQATYVDEMLFHSSWDWLIPVIAEIKKRFMEMSIDIYDKYESEVHNIEDGIWDGDIETVFYTVVVLIKSYNKNK